MESSIHDKARERRGIIIGINPGADVEHKRWNPDSYAVVADRLVEIFNARIVLLGGPGEEAMSQYIDSKMQSDTINLAGKLTLNDLVYIISGLDLLLTNDSGPMHIGAAVKTPLVAIFGPEMPAHTRPYTMSEFYGIVYKDIDCRPCRKKSCGRPVCLDLITPEEVTQKCVEMLESCAEFAENFAGTPAG
jgi:ADP-heptose:LPS heptosyltransferase